MLYESKFVLALLVTLIVEIPILIFFFRYVFKTNRIPLQKLISTGIIASALTLPYLWFVLLPYVSTDYYFFIGETFVIIVESLIYYQIIELKLEKSLLLSFISNISSYLIGIIIFNNISSIT
jgi:hypothetical protein